MTTRQAQAAVKRALRMLDDAGVILQALRVDAVNTQVAAAAMLAADCTIHAGIAAERLQRSIDGTVGEWIASLSGERGSGRLDFLIGCLIAALLAFAIVLGGTVAP